MGSGNADCRRLAAAAAAPIVVEATDRGKAVVAEAAGRGKAVVAAAKGEVPAPKPKSRWLKRLAIVIAVGGIAAIVAPGGSIRDDEVIAAAEKAGVTLYFTGTRHFAH